MVLEAIVIGVVLEFVPHLAQFPLPCSVMELTSLYAALEHNTGEQTPNFIHLPSGLGISLSTREDPALNKADSSPHLTFSSRQMGN